jgi:hypothetical protein
MALPNSHSYGYDRLCRLACRIIRYNDEDFAGVLYGFDIFLENTIMSIRYVV